MRLALGEQSDLLLEGQRVVPARLESEGFRFRYPTLAAALRSLK
jgi:NAD dependent epimerase/dehydratase family enzyme